MTRTPGDSIVSEIVFWAVAPFLLVLALIAGVAGWIFDGDEPQYDKYEDSGRG